MKMDLLLNQEAFAQASRELKKERENLEILRANIVESLAQLELDWDSDAGKQFFLRFQEDLIKNLDRYIIVFEYMSQNLSTASQKYEEVFRAADAVADAQY